MENKKYKINWLEKKVGKSGKEYIVMSLVDEGGIETQNVSSFEMKYELAQEIEGKIIQNGNFLNWKPKLEAPEFIKKGNSAYKEKIINETMQRKEGSIAKFQDNKEWSIKVSSTMRDAVLLAIAEGKPEAERVLAWRKWLWNNWDVELDDTDALTGNIN